MHGEPQALVHRHRRRVGGVDVQHRRLDAAGDDRFEARQRQLAAEAEALEVRIDTDHVDLAEPFGCRFVGLVQLRPAEGGEPSVALVEQESRWIEPRFGLAGEHRVDGPAALFGVAGEGAVVDGHPCRFVDARTERARCHRDGQAGRQRAAHLQQPATGHQPERRGRRFVGRGGASHPPVHDATSVGGNRVEGRGDQRRGCLGVSIGHGDRRGVVADGDGRVTERSTVVVQRQLRADRPDGGGVGPPDVEPLHDAATYRP